MIKPRAHQSATNGYWVVWSVENGTVIQGVGDTLRAAFHDWYEAGWPLTSLVGSNA
jgi:hypothetical protein